MDVLFILDRWCAGNKNWGLSAWENNLVTSFRSSYPDKIFNSFHYDEYLDQNPNEDPNEYVKNIISRECPNFIFIVVYEHLGSKPSVITLDTVKFIKSRGIPIFSIFGDLEHKKQCEIANTIAPYCRAVFFTALSNPGSNISSKNFFYSWVPKDPSIFKSTNDIEKDIFISYVGSPKPDRVRTVEFLRKRDVPVFVTGGERQVNLSTEDFGTILKRSKITISFSRAAGSHVINARAFEAMSCGALLLEQAGMETPKLFRPYVDYIPFFSRQDLVSKVKFLERNPDVLETIAKSGEERVKLLFSAKRFWRDVISLSDVDDPCIAPKNSRDWEEYWNSEVSARGKVNFDPSIYFGFSQLLIIYFSILEFLRDKVYLWRVRNFFRSCILYPRIFLSKTKFYMVSFLR